jgi:hypothetical protein
MPAAADPARRQAGVRGQLFRVSANLLTLDLSDPVQLSRHRSHRCRADLAASPAFRDHLGLGTRRRPSARSDPLPRLPIVIAPEFDDSGG